MCVYIYTHIKCNSRLPVITADNRKDYDNVPLHLFKVMYRTELLLLTFPSLIFGLPHSIKRFKAAHRQMISGLENFVGLGTDLFGEVRK